MSFKFQQYIPVKAGGGGSDPDPAVYCPANGYLPPEPDGTYIPPIDIGTPETEEIRLLVTSEGISKIRLICQGAYNVKIYNALDDLIVNTNVFSLNYFIYVFQENTGYYIIKITPQAANNITLFRLAEDLTTGYGALYFKVIEAKFFTPLMATLNSAFAGCKLIKSALFYANMPNLTQMQSFFNNSGIEKYVFQNTIQFGSVNNLQLDNFCAFSTIRNFDFNNVTFATCTSMSAFFDSCIDLVSLNCQWNMPKLITMSYFIRNCTKLKIFDLSPVKLKVTNNTIIVTRMVQGCSSLETFIFFDTDPANASAVGIRCDYCIEATPNLKKMVYNGWIRLYQYYMFNYSPPRMYEVIMAPKLILDTILSIGPSNGTVEKITLPLEMSSNNVPGYSDFSNFQGQNVKELIGECNWGSTVYYFTFLSYYIVNFYQPTLKVSMFSIGNNGGALQTVEIDWANSWPNGSYTLNATIFSIQGNVSAVELNRIFSLLPALTTAAKLYASRCTGYAASDKTLATAKGWTVT